MLLPVGVVKCPLHRDRANEDIAERDANGLER